MTITATSEEIERLDAAEHILINGWAYHLRHGQSARFVASLIESAVGYEPRLGMHMDTCQGPRCELLVDENARDENGDLFCGDGCRDARAEAAFEAYQERVTAAYWGGEGNWPEMPPQVKRGRPADIYFVSPGAQR